MSNQSGSGKGHPSQDQALQKTRREKELLEDSLNRQTKENEKLKKRIDHLEKENKKLKKELAAARKVPKWVEPNKTENQKKKG